MKDKKWKVGMYQYITRYGGNVLIYILLIRFFSNNTCYLHVWYNALNWLVLLFQYTRASSMLSAGGIRHQFSLKENIQMSMFTTEFIRNIRDHLSVLGTNIKIEFAITILYWFLTILKYYTLCKFLE